MDFCFKFFLSILISFESQRLSSAAPAIENEITNGLNSSFEVFRSSYAQRMKSFMNASIDPCDDFYAYACGNYPNVIENIELIRKQNSFYDYSLSMNTFIDEILKKKRQPNDKYYEELQKVKYYVDVCDKADLFPLTPSEEYLKTIKAIGGFPAVDPTWNASTFDWFNMTAHLVRYGIVGFVEEKSHNSFPFTIYYKIGNFGFGLNVDSENIRTNESLGYVHSVEMMNRLLKVYGVTGPKADKVIEEIIDFWREALVYQNNTKNNCFDFENDGSFKDWFPEWKSLNDIAWGLGDATENGFSPCPCLKYYQQLNVFANKSSETMANYMALKFLYKMHPQVKSAKYQHQHCVSQVKYAIPMVLTYFYIQEHLSNETHQEVEEIIEQMCNSFSTIVKTIDWLDETAQRKVQDRLNTLRFTIGQAVDPVSDTYIKETMKLNLTNNYALNNLELSIFKVNLSRHVYFNNNTISKATLLDILKAILPNAFYDYTEHTIHILAGKLFPPIYHRDLPKSIKYSGLGYTIGHEIVHSIAPLGFKHLKRIIKLYNVTEKSAISSVTSNLQCFIEHHSNFTVPELNIKLNGKLSLTEAVCDSAGLKGSLAAFRSVMKPNVENEERDYELTESMPELNLSSEQTFFLNFAQLYCSKYEPIHFWNEMKGDYPMDKYRVLWPLQNFDEFSKVFNCSLGSRMNPENKCSLW